MSETESHPKDTIYTPERFNNDFLSEVKYLNAQTEAFWQKERTTLENCFALDEDFCDDDDREPIKALDIGCGTGMFLRLLLRDFPAVTAQGVDVNSRFVQVAKQDSAEYIEAKRLKCSTQSIYSLDFPDNTFDLVTTRFVFQHLVYPKKAFAEVERVLKPGGRMILATSSESPDVVHPNINEVNLLWKALWTDQASNAFEVTGQEQPDLNPIHSESNPTVWGENKCATAMSAHGFKGVSVETIIIDSAETKDLQFCLPLMDPRQHEHLVGKKLVSQNIYDEAVRKFDEAVRAYAIDQNALRWIGYETLITGTI